MEISPTTRGAGFLTREQSLLRENEALRRLSRAVATNQTRIPIAFQAAYAIQGSLDLAGVLVWAVEQSRGTAVLLASAGMQHPLPDGLTTLPLEGPVDTLSAEALAAGRPVWTPHLGPTLESTGCKTPTGSAAALPLASGGSNVGVVTLLARADDRFFLSAQDLHVTLAETLAMALGSASKFESVERLATVDPLTGIANHRALQETLANEIAIAKGSNTPVSVAMIDVDHFRQFNEEEGHDCGDDVLRLVAAAIAGQCRPGDLAARYGGEEFTLVMPNADQSQAMGLVEATRQEIQSIRLVAKSGMQRAITASIGIATFPDSGVPEAELLKAADRALYRAKRTGRNRSVLYRPEFGDGTSQAADALQAVRAVCPMDAWAQGEALQHRSGKRIASLQRVLGLSDSTAETVRTALLLLPAWQAAAERADMVFIQTLCSASGLGGVGKALAYFEERYDGGGEHRCLADDIPLESRILSALVAFDKGGKRCFGQDVGRFDPAIAEILAEGAHAA